MTVAMPNRVYEDFDPPSDLVPEQGYDTILVYLPGFKKEQLRVQLTTSRILKVSGERPIGDNKWRRFHKEFRVSPNCDTKEITAKYEGGVLYIRQPKLITPEPPKPQPSQPSVPQSQPQPQPPSNLPEKAEEGKREKEEAEAKVADEKRREREENAKAEERREKEKEEKKEEGGRAREKEEKCESTGGRLQQLVESGSGFFKELKKRENLKRLGVSVLMVVVVGFYISYVIKSFTGKEQHSVMEVDREL